MTEQLVRRYYLDMRYGCSLTLCHTCSAFVGSSFATEYDMLLKNFGSALYREGLCTAYTSCIAMSHIFALKSQCPNRSEILLQVTEALYDLYHSQFGSQLCGSIRLTHAKSDVGCLQILILSAEMMVEIAHSFQICDPIFPIW